jgi:hypothetical protein
MILYFINRLYLLLAILLIPTCIWGQNESSQKAVSEIRNKIILWYNSEISIQADGALCFYDEGSYVVTQVVSPCENFFNKIIESLTVPSIKKLERDRSIFLVNGLSKYIVLLMVAIQENTIDDYEPFLGQISIIAVLLNQIVMEAPEFFSDEELFNSLFSSYEVLVKVFFEKIPDAPTVVLSQVMLERSNLLIARGSQGIVLKELLSFFYGDPSTYVMRKLSYSNESFFSYFIFWIEEIGTQQRFKTSPHFQVEGHKGSNFMQSFFISILCFLCTVSYFVYISFRSKCMIDPEHPILDKGFLNSNERAELRDLRQFFNLRPAEGIETLHKHYRSLVRTLHPDMIHDSGESFIEFQERYLRAKFLLDRLQEEKIKRFANDR